MEIRFEKTEHPMEKPDQKNLGFGKHFTDYMFVMDWDREQGLGTHTLNIRLFNTPELISIQLGGDQ